MLASRRKVIIRRYCRFLQYLDPDQLIGLMGYSSTLVEHNLDLLPQCPHTLVWQAAQLYLTFGRQAISYREIFLYGIL
jgi:hypothetical protein